LSDTIASIKKLSDISGTIKKNQTVDKLKKEIETLTDKLSDKDKTIKELSEAKVAAKPADTTSE
jgi:predicted RNase H-like nuclease (RuvC/YqgF family)